MITAIPEGWQPNRIVRDQERHGRYQIAETLDGSFVIKRFPNLAKDPSDRCNVMASFSSVRFDDLLTALAAVSRDIEKLDACTANPCVHLSRHGRALCGLSGIPAYWPDGNKWVCLDEAHEANCEECKGVLARAQVEGLL